MGAKHLEVTEHKVSMLKKNKKSNLFVHFMFAYKVAVMEHDLIFPPFIPCTVIDLCCMCSGVRRGTPVCCCNYFDYTCYGVLQQSAERVQFNQR